jgi:hypothetical protein
MRSDCKVKCRLLLELPEGMGTARDTLERGNDPKTVSVKLGRFAGASRECVAVRAATTLSPGDQLGWLPLAHLPIHFATAIG